MPADPQTTACLYCGKPMLPRADGLGNVCPSHCAERRAENPTGTTPERPELPPGFTVHNDGPGREVLSDPHDDESAHVFPTRARAAEIAWLWWDSIYFRDMEDADG